MLLMPTYISTWLEWCVLLASCLSSHKAFTRITLLVPAASHVVCTVQIGDIGLVEFLLQNGAKWDRADPYGRTPLHYSILHEHPVVAKQLLKR